MLKSALRILVKGMKIEILYRKVVKSDELNFLKIKCPIFGFLNKCP